MPFSFCVGYGVIDPTIENLKIAALFQLPSYICKAAAYSVWICRYLLLFYRGNLISVQMLLKCFKTFSQSSGLIANDDKNSIYPWEGVNPDDQIALIQALGFTKGELLVRYLVVPLSQRMWSS